MSDNGRKMIYPVTLPQQIKHFPFRFHWNHMPRFPQLFYSFLLGIPVFYYFQKLSYSPENVKKYEAYLRKQEEELKQHMHHLEGFRED